MFFNSEIKNSRQRVNKKGSSGFSSEDRGRTFPNHNLSRWNRTAATAEAEEGEMLTLPLLCCGDGLFENKDAKPAADFLADRFAPSIPVATKAFV